MVDELEKL